MKCYLIFPVIALAAGGLARAVVNGPYSVDADTVHLWHLDEAAGATAAANAVSGKMPLIPFNGAAAPASTTAVQPSLASVLGASGAAAFGNCAVLANVAHGLGYDANGSGGFQPGTAGGGADVIAQSTLTGSDGSFTIEALVNIPDLSVKREIIATDSSMANRCFQFYTDSDGTLRFNFIASGATTSASATIPVTGVHAFAANQWFHVAYAHNGATSSGVFYWTRLDAASGSANALAASGSEVAAGTYTGPLVIGNEARAASGEGLQGYIDEVRISRIARGPSGFLFVSSNPDSDGDGLPDAWELSMFGSVTAQDGSGDPDGDFATNAREAAANTSPVLATEWPDTDADSINDGWETHYFGSLSHDGSADSDGDGATDWQEYLANTSPTNNLWAPGKAMLSHRWSFNGTLADSSGDAKAILVDPDGSSATGGGATLGPSDVLLDGGSRGASSYVQLGKGGLLAGRRTPVTLEMWATQVAVQNWSRVFDFGSGTTNYLMASWTRGTAAAQDRIEWKGAATGTANDTCAPYTAGTAYHIVMAIEPRAGPAGTTRVTWYAAPAGSATLGAARGTFDTADTLLSLNDTSGWLGRSQFTADNTANARYDEVRIWEGALSQAERENHQTSGPDAVASEDSDGDSLPDAWEMIRFGNLGQSAAGDPDGDGYSNTSEYAAASNPALAASTPLDLDADGLADAWETSWFGNLAQTAAGDPDADGESNVLEQANGSAPNNGVSNAADRDAEGLPDAWETQYFGGLSHNAGDDPDGDGFSNLQEFQAGTHPGDAASRPAGVAARLVPLDDGNAGTSEFGYAGPSAINTVSFVRSSLRTVGNQQFVTWYGRHQSDAAAAYNNTIWVGRRTLGSAHWEVFRHPTFAANAITDGHDVISYGIDGEGYMHVSWGMHGDAFHYSRSTLPVTGANPIVLGPDSTMTGREATVTYPQFFKLPDGDLLFLFREGVSGAGDTYLNRYDTATHTWDNVHRSGTTQLPFIKGTGWTPDYNAYPNMPAVDAAGRMTLTWCWRYNGDSPAGQSGYQTNNNCAFARSGDAGATWSRYNGTPYALPISRSGESGVAATAAEHITTIPEGYSLINQAGMCLDTAGNPVVGSWWAPLTGSGNYRRQYMIVFRNGHGTASTADDTWDTRAVSDRTLDPAGTKYPETYVRNLGRPVVVCDDAGRIIMAYRDNAGSNGLTIVHSLPLADDPERLVWTQFDLTTENLGNYEPIIDNELWDRDRQLHFLYQASEGEGYTPPANNAARFSILEWNAKSYFGTVAQPKLSFAANGADALLTCPTDPSFDYRLWSGTDLIHWEVVATVAGTGSPVTFTHPGGAVGPKRFWRIERKEGGW